MYAKRSRTVARLLVVLACVACTSLAGKVAAKDKIVTVSIPVSARGLNLTRPADAKTFYTRLQNAARLVCTSGNWINPLKPVDIFQDCYEKALGDAVHSINRPLITQIYLATHSPEEAAKHGFELSWQVAAK